MKQNNVTLTLTKTASQFLYKLTPFQRNVVYKPLDPYR